MKKVAWLVLLIAVSSFATDGIPVPEAQKWHMLALEAKIQADQTQITLLQLATERAKSDIDALNKEHAQVVDETYAEAKLNKGEWFLDAASWTFLKIEKPPAPK